mgnify:CR=1 FL=1
MCAICVQEEAVEHSMSSLREELARVSTLTGTLQTALAAKEQVCTVHSAVHSVLLRHTVLAHSL